VGRHRVGLEDIEAVHSRGGGWFRGRVQAGKLEAGSGCDNVAGSKIGLEQKSSLGAPRNAPLRTGRKPGAETALFL